MDRSGTTTTAVVSAGSTATAASSVCPVGAARHGRAAHAARSARPAHGIAPGGCDRPAPPSTVLDRRAAAATSRPGSVPAEAAAVDTARAGTAPTDAPAATPAAVDPAAVDPAAVELVARCDAELVAAQLAPDPADRFLHAHLGALRLAGALLAAAGARPPRGRPRSAWDRLTAAVPECAPWAAFFTTGAPIRASLDAGVDSVDDALATTWVNATEDFRDEVCRRIGIDPYADLRSARAGMAWAS